MKANNSYSDKEGLRLDSSDKIVKLSKNRNYLITIGVLKK